MKKQVTISAAVEGLVDEAVVRKLIDVAGGNAGAVFGKRGKPYLRQSILGFNNAARYSPWFVLVDLDHDEECAPPMRTDWISDPAPYLCFRVAVREIEAWLMGDVESLASFLGVARSRIPINPESLPDPKTEMVNLARHSRRRDIRFDMVPREQSGRVVGPAYTSRLIEYVQTLWRPHVAVEYIDSLRRAVDDLKRTLESVKV